MKFYSEITKQFYDDADACATAEDKAKAEIKARETKKKKLAETKKARAKEVSDAYQKIREAQKEFDKLKSDFIKDYGYFHFSYTDPDETSVFSIFEDLFKI